MNGHTLGATAAEGEGLEEEEEVEEDREEGGDWGAGIGKEVGVSLWMGWVDGRYFTELRCREGRGR